MTHYPSTYTPISSRFHHQLVSTCYLSFTIHDPPPYHLFTQTTKRWALLACPWLATPPGLWAAHICVIWAAAEGRGRNQLAAGRSAALLAEGAVVVEGLSAFEGTCFCSLTCETAFKAGLGTDCTGPLGTALTTEAFAVGGLAFFAV